MSRRILLLDSTSWIFYFRHSFDRQTLKTQKKIREIYKNGQLAVCGQVLSEIIQGLGESKKEKMIREFLMKTPYLETNREVFLFAGDLSRELVKRGFVTPLSDCLIAAIAIFYKATLVSSDPHFKSFKNLNLIFIE